MSAPTWPFSWPSPPSWITNNVDQAAELAAQDPWQTFPVYKLRVGRIVARVSLCEIRPPSWDARIVIVDDPDVRDLGWFYTAAEARAAVEQTIAELAAET